MQKRKNDSNIFSYIVLAIVAMVWIVPLYMVFVTSLKSTADLFQNVFGLPEKFLFSNFVKVWSEIRITLYLRNSFVITMISLIIIVVVGSIASYAITRSGWKITKRLYYVFILGLMIPTQVGMVPLFMSIKKMGLYNNPIGLVCAYVGMAIPIAVFMFVGFFRTLPSAILESAFIDGCGEFMIYRKIVMPLSTSVISTVIIYNSVVIWNDFTYPLLFTRGETWKTLPLGIYSMKGQYMSDYPLMFAGIVLATIPVLLAYIFLQKQFIAGMTAGAVKG